MSNEVPAQPKIYHIVHVDRLPSIINDGFLWCDAEIRVRPLPGTSIGMSSIKQRRLNELILSSHPNLYVGGCVPFYFCPRSVMLYVISQANHEELLYQGGQEPIVHLEADFHATVEWANQNQRRWAFTSLNAGSYYFEDYNDLAQLDRVDWQAVQATEWKSCKDGKQAEFLIEKGFPWHLIECIGVYSPIIDEQVANALPINGHRPQVKVDRLWYY